MHYFYSQECFCNKVKAFVTLPLGRLRKLKGEVRCDAGAHKRMLGLNEVANIITGDIDEQLFERLHELQEAEMAALFTRQLNEEKRRLERQTVAQMHFNRITEDVLTLHCPRCKKAFVDFKHCYALDCNACPCGFCALCLKDCGKDAHGDLSRCEILLALQGRGEIFDQDNS